MSGMKWDATIHFVHKGTDNEMNTQLPINAISHEAAIKQAERWALSLRHIGTVKKIEVVPVDEI
jgi:hypothetical protein